MERRTPIFIIASPRPRVGKTLLARMLAEFFRSEERPVAAFDVNPDEFDLMDYLPGYTAVASISDTRGQIALFDQLLAYDQVPKAVDLSHTQFYKFFTVVHQIDFVEEARRRNLSPVVLFVAAADRRARQGYAMLRDRFPELPLVPVINEALPQIMFRPEQFPSGRYGGPLSLPALSPVVKGIIERPSFSFSALAATVDVTTELYTWTRRVFLQFRELELQLLLADLRPALKFSA
jgi:hypothetical protein